MKSLSHEHIISLVGVCMDSPIWLVMELAPLGELRQYLQAHKASLDLQTLILFATQVAKALQVFNSLHFSFYFYIYSISTSATLSTETWRPEMSWSRREIVQN